MDILQRAAARLPAGAKAVFVDRTRWPWRVAQSPSGPWNRVPEHAAAGWDRGGRHEFARERGATHVVELRAYLDFGALDGLCTRAVVCRVR